MRRSLLLICASFLFLTAAGFAQESGRFIITVQTAPDPATPARQVAGAKVIVVHWANAGLHPTMVQDQIATTNQMGMCMIELPPGAYEVFVSASGLMPAAFRRDLKVGESTSLLANLTPAPLHLRPVQ